MNNLFNPAKKWEKKIKKTETLLDIGCWSGQKILVLSKKCKKAYGLDINTERFKFADPEIKHNLFFGDVTKKIPFNEKFDWITLGEVLEHVDKDEEALKNISGSLKKGGKLILSTPREVRFFNFWDPAWVKWKFFNGERHYHYSEKELTHKLQKFGLKIKEIHIGGNLSWVMRRWINVILRYIFKMNKQIKNPLNKGFCDFIVLAEKIDETN